jgi:hypothetical protein
VSRGFAYQIDYAAAIADDERVIAAHTSPEAIVISTYLDTLEARMRDRFSTGRDYVLAAFVGVAERAAKIGLEGEELAAFLVFTEASEFDAFPADQRAGRYHLGKIADARVGQIPACDTATRKAVIKHAKAALARHKRNRAEYG